MKHTKVQIENIVKKLLKDTNRDYLKNMPFEIIYKNKLKTLFLKNEISNAWDVTVYVKEDQFTEKEEYSIIVIVIDDNNEEIISYADMSCGRPVPLKAVLNNGFYELMML